MLNQATMDMLTAMKMTAMPAEFANQLKDPTFNELGFEERLGLLVNAEWNRRQSNKLNRFIRNARFAVPSSTVEGIEYHEDRKLDKAQMLRFATCQYIDEGHHIILKGASGNGKTYIACALGNAACRRFKKVQYIRMPELLDELSICRPQDFFLNMGRTKRKRKLVEWLESCQENQVSVLDEKIPLLSFAVDFVTAYEYQKARGIKIHPGLWKDMRVDIFLVKKEN